MHVSDAAQHTAKLHEAPSAAAAIANTGGSDAHSDSACSPSRLLSASSPLTLTRSAPSDQGTAASTAENALSGQVVTELTDKLERLTCSYRECEEALRISRAECRHGTYMPICSCYLVFTLRFTRVPVTCVV